MKASPSDLSKPGSWWLISREDTSDIADGLLAINDNESLPFEVRALASSLLHTLDTGTHDTSEAPADFAPQS